MVSHLPPPYEYQRVEDYFYTFTNRDGIRYKVFFSPISDLYPQFINTYSFSIEPEEYRPHPIDRQIAITVVDILRRFFADNENAMIMVCDSTDGKEGKRRLLFDHWFSVFNDGSIEKYDAAAETAEYKLYLSIYFTHENPYRQQLITAFRSLISNDLYSIVI